MKKGYYYECTSERVQKGIRVGEAVREVEHVELLVGRRRGQPREILGPEDHVARRARQRALTRTCALGRTRYTCSTSSYARVTSILERVSQANKIENAQNGTTND